MSVSTGKMQLTGTSFLNKRTAFQHCSSLPRQSRQHSLVQAVATRSKVPLQQQRPAVDVLERSLQLESSSGREHAEASSSGTLESRGSKRSIDEGEVLHSTFEHQAIVYGTTTLLSALLLKGFSDVHDVPAAFGAAAAALLAYYVSGGAPPLVDFPLDKIAVRKMMVAEAKCALCQQCCPCLASTCKSADRWCTPSC